MKKSILKSKTFWGFGLAIAITGLQSMGLIDPNMVAEFVKYLSAIVGVWGARDAVNR